MVNYIEVARFWALEQFSLLRGDIVLAEYYASKREDAKYG